MYARKVKGKELNFAVSGKLWQRSLIIEDDETGTEWSHLLGKAMAGPLKGTQLEVIPSLLTDWKTWKKSHPKTSTLNLSRTVRNYVRAFQEKNPGRFVLGLASPISPNQAKAYSFEALRKMPVVNDVFDQDPVVIVYVKSAATANAFYRTIQASKKTESIKLTFKPELINGQLVDTETSSTWDPFTGICLSGKLAGSTLRQAPGIPSFRTAWMKFHPESKEFQP